MSLSTRTRRSARSRIGVVTLAAATVGTACLSLGPGTSSASSHREAPLTSADADIDNTDTYAFVSPDKPDSVTLITNVKPFQLPAGGPNFDPFPNKDDVRYNINVDTNGDAKPDLTYRFTFTGGFKNKGTFLYNTGPVKSLKDPTLNFQQDYRVDLVKPSGTTTLIEGGKVSPNNVGKASMPDYAALRQEALATGKAKDGTLTFAGPADDPFFIDIRVFDLLYGGDLSESGNPSLSGLNVSTLAVQVPRKVIAATAGADNKSSVIGVYATTERRSVTLAANGTRSSSGNWVQVSRLGAPLVNEVVSSVALKDAFNNLPPAKDASVKGLVDRVADPEVPKLIQKIYKIPAPAAPRKDIMAIFLTGLKGLNLPTKGTPSEMLRLNTSIPPNASPNRLGVLGGDKAGFPNGRRLTDDVVDEELQALEGAVQADGSIKLVEPLAKGDGVDANDVDFETAFPYVALPHAGSNPGTGGTGTTNAEGASASGASPSAEAGGSSSAPAAAAAPTKGAKAGFGGSASRAPLVGGFTLLLGLFVLGFAVVRRRQASITS